ncbi:Methionine-R-sulfoxide reductase B3 [Acropora cervicornis]|uniref:peptide-methionine (R)-S-oxide reductase n=1 Tax=Acropora cervicornis TaxID=6130 RepID=A0AAD9VE34_ACRCE|nr:Methionine-R-sulfoxide reductase B3 [Acropora cervicornis]
MSDVFLQFLVAIISLIKMGSEGLCFLVATKTDQEPYKVVFTTKELKERLSPQEYYVTQEKGTERAFTGRLVYNKEKGVYKCTVCDKVLFKSDTKFESGSGIALIKCPQNNDLHNLVMSAVFGYLPLALARKTGVSCKVKVIQT